MRFTFVYAGWEGSVHDARVFDAATADPTLGFPHPPLGKYYAVDSGYANQLGYLTPFRGEKYHLQDFRGGGTPTTAKELFNYRHSSLRNVIERTFGVLKNRFHILRSMRSYNIETQASIVIACCGLHNYIKEQQLADAYFEEYNDTERVVDDELNPQTLDFQATHTSQRDGGRQMIETRKTIANQLAVSMRLDTIE